MANRNQALRRHLGMTLYGAPLLRRPRICMYDGQFDMVHYGHLGCAQWLRIFKKLDKVVWVPCGESPNDKPDSLPGDARYDMLVAGTASNQHFDVSRASIRRKGTSYMINSVEAMFDEYGDDIDLSVMISSEYLNPDHKYFLPKWIGAKELFKIKNLTFLVFPRDRVSVSQIQEWARLVPQARIEPLNAPSPPLSSTMIRQWVSQGRSIWYTTPWQVQRIIEKRGYYLKPGQEPYRHNAPPLSQVSHVGIYPGSFDPIHYGDLLRAEWARQERQMDRVLFAPSATPPNNRSISATAEERCDMSVAGTADNPFFDVMRTDVDSGKTAYTLQTVQEARRRFGKDVELSVLLRSEYLNPKHPFHLSNWMGAQELFKLTRFVAFPRDWTEIELVQTWAKRVPNASIEVVYAPGMPIDSHDIRELVEHGHPTLYFTPGDVQQLIAKKGLYGYGKANSRASRKSK